MDLKDKLIAKQAELGLNDQEMAERLGLQRPMWAMIRTGQTGLGLKVLRGILRGFPELTVEVLDFMRSERMKMGDGSEIGKAS